MTDPTDARIPLVFATPDQAGSGDALLVEGQHQLATACFTPNAAGHSPACPCCSPRSSAGRALAALLHGRARGEVRFFNRVVVWTRTEAGRAALVHAVTRDPVASAGFRLSPAPAHHGPPSPVNVA